MATAVALLLAGCDDGDSASTTTTSGAPATTSTTAVTSTTASPGTTASPATTSTTAPVPAPPQVTGLTATTGGGSGEVVVTWPPLPASVDVASYRLYKRRANGIELSPATVLPASVGTPEPGRLGVVDAPDTGPWPTTDPDPGPRCYRVSAVSTGGVEGPVSVEACGSPVGGT